MKLILEIADNKAADFMALIKTYPSLKSRQLSSADAELFEEINEIKKAFKNVDLIKSGKLKGRPVDDLLNEL